MRRGVTARAHEEQCTLRPALFDRDVPLQHVRVRETVLADVLRDPDDNVAPPGRVAADHDALTDRVLARPECRGHSLTHHRHALTIGAVGVRDRASTQNARSDGLEVIGRRHLYGEAAGLPQRVDPRHGESHSLRAPERDTDATRGGLHLGHASRGVYEPPGECRTLVGWQSETAQVGQRHEDWIHVETEIHCPHVSQAADEEPRPDEQHNGQRRLQHQQRRTRARALVGALAGAGLERRRERPPPGLQPRHESNEDANDDHGGSGEA